MSRTKQFNREQRNRHINRKKRIINDKMHNWVYRHEGSLSKGKIHCSCWMCSEKTVVRGYKHSDLVEIERCIYEEKQFEEYIDR